MIAGSKTRDQLDGRKKIIEQKRNKEKASDRNLAQALTFTKMLAKCRGEAAILIGNTPSEIPSGSTRAVLNAPFFSIERKTYEGVRPKYPSA